MHLHIIDCQFFASRCFNLDSVVLPKKLEISLSRLWIFDAWFCSCLDTTWFGFWSLIYGVQPHTKHTAHKKEFRKGNCVALKRHGTELFSQPLHVCSKTNISRSKEAILLVQFATHIKRLREGFSNISIFGDTSFVNKWAICLNWLNLGHWATKSQLSWIKYD